MRFVWAVAAFVLAALMIGAGIAQRTIFEGPTSQTEEIDVTGSAPYVLIDGAVLTSHEGSQTLRVQDDGAIFAAYGRTEDLRAWLARSDYTAVTGAEDRVQTTTVTATDRSAAAGTPAQPQGSDLWLDEFQQDDVLITPLQLPADMSVLVATDGVAPAPNALSVTWPVPNATPWAGPLIVGGAVLLAVGIVLYLLGVRHVRRSRGPRRKGLPVPVTEPIDLAVDAGEKKGVITSSPPRRRLIPGRRAFVAVPAITVAALAFSSCSPEAWPQLDGQATPSPTASVVTPEGQGSPVVTEAQAQRIIGRISDEVQTADAASDVAAAATRLAGTALATREVDYRLRAAVPGFAAAEAIPDGPLQIILPEANDQWPRTFFAVSSGGQSHPDVVMSVTQDDPWATYKVTTMAELTSDTTLQLAPPYVGAIPIPADSPFLSIAPDELAAAYADVLTNGQNSTFAPLFDIADDAFIQRVDAGRAQSLADFSQSGSQTGAMTFFAEAGAAEPVALATLDSGAIVAVTVHDGDTVKATNSDAVIKVEGSPMLQTLSGVSSANGFTTTYANQLFFFVPSQSSKERIRVLGFSSHILDAKVAQ